MTDKLQPHSREAESALLGSIMLCFSLISEVRGKLTIENIYVPEHQFIYKAMLELANRPNISMDCKPIDLVALVEQLKIQGDLDLCGGIPYLSSLSASVPVSTNWQHYLEIILNRFSQRKLITLLVPITNRLYDECSSEDVSLALNQLQTGIVEIQNQQSSGSVIDPASAIRDTVSLIASFSESKGGITGLSTGLKALDRMTCGLQDGDYIVIAGRPSMGKTALAMNIMDHNAAQGRASLVFSLEMSQPTLGLRRIAAMANVSIKGIRAGILSETDFARIADAAQKLRSLPLYINDKSGLSIEQIRDIARTEKLNKNIKLILIDHIAKVNTLKNFRNEEAKLTYVSEQICQMKKELGIPVIVLCQLNRELTKRNNPVPQLTDIRGCGSIEQDADVAIFPHRPDYYNSEQESQEAEVASLYVLKQRNGERGPVPAMFVGKFCKFVDYHPGDM